MKIFGFVLFLQDVMLMLIMSDKNKKTNCCFRTKKKFGLTGSESFGTTAGAASSAKTHFNFESLTVNFDESCFH